MSNKLTASERRSTGVFDKTGREIFEGDICRFTQGKPGCEPGICKIVFHHGAFRGKQTVGRFDYFVPFADEAPAFRPENHYTVISNV